jgi:hypothetical protein
LAVVENEVEGGYAGAIQHNVILRALSQANDPSNFERVKVKLSGGANNFELGLSCACCESHAFVRFWLVARFRG